MTKFLIVVAFCTLIGGGVVRAEISDEIMNIVLDCAKEVDISKESLKELQDKQFEDLVPTENMKCHTRCVLKKAGFVDGDKLNEDKIKEVYAASAQAAVDACKGTYKGADTCDEAWDTLKCFYEHSMQ